MTRCMTWRTGLVAVAALYFALAFLCLMYLPNFDGLLRDDETDNEHHHKPKHRHIRVREWLKQRCINVSSGAPAGLVTSYQLTRKYGAGQRHQEPALYLMSAYYDARKELSHYIRILAAVPRSAKPELNLHCHVPLAPDVYFTVPGTPYEMNENHGMPYGAYVFSCALPPHLQVSEPVFSVVITNGPEPTRDLDGRPVPSVELPLLTVPRELESAAPYKLQPRKFTVCVPPLFGTPSERRLLDFIERSRALGAEHFVFYLTDEIYSTEANRALLRLMNSYASRGLATLFRWQPVNRFRSQVHYHGQVLAVHHCLYWNMGLSKYAVFQDFDELLVPNAAKYRSWSDMAKDIDDGTHCGFRFFSAFFEPDQGYFDAKRTAGISRVRTKCMVKPDLIFEMGIHHISKQNVEEMTPVNKQPDVALLHHYSRCTLAFDNGAGDLCSKYVADTELHSWRKQFEQLKLETVHALNTSAQ